MSFSTFLIGFVFFHKLSNWHTWLTKWSFTLLYAWDYGDPLLSPMLFRTTVLHDYSYDLFQPGLFEKSLIGSDWPSYFFWGSTCYWSSLRAISEAPRLFFACSGIRGHRDACSIVHPKSYATDKVRVQEVFAAFRVLKSVHWRRR